MFIPLLPQPPKTNHPTPPYQHHPPHHPSQQHPPHKSTTCSSMATLPNLLLPTLSSPNQPLLTFLVMNMHYFMPFGTKSTHSLGKNHFSNLERQLTFVGSTSRPADVRPVTRLLNIGITPKLGNTQKSFDISNKNFK